MGESALSSHARGKKHQALVARMLASGTPRISEFWEKPSIPSTQSSAKTSSSSASVCIFSYHSMTISTGLCESVMFE